MQALGRIGNRVKFTNDTATVSVEAPHMAKAGHWSFALRRLRGCCKYASQETCLNGVLGQAPQVRSAGCFVRGKTAAATIMVAAAVSLPPCNRAVPAKGPRHCVRRKGGPDTRHFNRFFAWRYDNEKTNRKPSPGSCHDPEPCPLLGFFCWTGRDKGAGARNRGEQHLFRGRRRSLGRYPCGHMGRDRRKIHHDGLRRRGIGGSRSDC